MEGDCYSDEYDCLLERYPRGSPGPGYGGEAASAVEWATRAARGMVGKAVGDKPRLYCHARELPSTKIRGWEWWAYTTRLKDRGLDPGSMSDDVILQEVEGEAKSPVAVEDFTKPPDRMVQEPLLMFNFDDFFNFVLSDSWPGQTTLRVVGGQLLDELIQTIVLLERRGTLKSFSSYAFLNNRRHNPDYDEYNEVIRKKNITLAWKASKQLPAVGSASSIIGEHDGEPSSVAVETVKEPTPLNDIPPPEWVFDTIYVRLIHYEKLSKEYCDDRKHTNESPLPGQPLAWRMYDLNKVKIPPEATITVQDRIDELEKEKTDIADLTKKCAILDQQKVQKDKQGAGKDKKEKSDKGETKKPDPPLAGKGKGKAGSQTFETENNDIEWIVGNEEGLTFSKTPESANKSLKKTSRLSVAGSKTALSKSAPRLRPSAGSMTSVSKLDDISENETEGKNNAADVKRSKSDQTHDVPVDEMLIDTQKTKTLTNVRSAKSVTSGTSIKSASLSKQTSGTTPRKLSTLSEGSVESVTETPNLQRLNLSQHERYVSGTYQAREKNRMSTNDKLKQINHKYTTAKREKAEKILKEATESEPFDIRDRFKKLSWKKEKDRIKATAPHLALKQSSLQVAVETEPWSSYYRHQDACDLGAATDNPQERKILQGFVNSQRKRREDPTDKFGTDNKAVTKGNKNKSHNKPTDQDAMEGLEPFEGHRMEEELSDYIMAWRLHLDHGVAMDHSDGLQYKYMNSKTINRDKDTNKKQSSAGTHTNENMLQPQKQRVDNKVRNIAKTVRISQNPPIGKLNKVGKHITITHKDSNVVKRKSSSVTETNIPSVFNKNHTLKQQNIRSSNIGRYECPLVQFNLTPTVMTYNNRRDFSSNNYSTKAAYGRGSLSADDIDDLNAVNNNQSADVGNEEDESAEPKTEHSGRTKMSVANNGELVKMTHEGTMSNASLASNIENAEQGLEGFEGGESEEEEVEEKEEGTPEEIMLRKLTIDMKLNNVECPCEDHPHTDILHGLRPVEHELPFTYPPILGQLRRDFRFLQHHEGDDTGRSHEVLNPGSGRASRLEVKPSGFPAFKTFDFERFVLESMNTLVVRREIMSSKNGQTYTTVTFSKPDIFEKILIKDRTLVLNNDIKSALIV